MKKRMQGSITVFTSLLLVLLLGILCTTLESARISGLKSKGKIATQSALFSLFSEYNNQLLEDYELFALTDDGDIENRIREYISYYEDPSQNLNTIYNGNYFPFQVDGINIENEVKLLDSHAQATEEEISEAMKYIVVEDVLSKIKESLGWIKNTKKITSYMDKLMKKSDEILSLQNKAVSTYEKTVLVKDTFKEFSKRVNSLKNNILEYKKAEKRGAQDLASAYQKQISTSIKNLLNQKTKLNQTLNAVKDSANNYIKDAQELNQYTENLQSDLKSTKEELGEEFYSALSEEMTGIIDLSGSEGRIYKQNNQAVSTSQENINLLSNLKGLQENITSSEDIAQVEKEISNWESQLSAYKSIEIDSIQENKTNIESQKKSNLLDMVQAVMNEGILALVVEDIEKISDRKIETVNFPSLTKNLKSEALLVPDQMVNAVLLNEYLLKYMPSYIDSANYDLEYVLSGKTEDKENLGRVVDKLLLVREGMNYAYLLTDTQKKLEADELAVAILGAASAAVITVPVLSNLILMAWAYAESISDVKTLLAGGKVSLLKSKSEWNLSLAEAGKGKNAWGKEKKNEKGLTYIDYLRILLYFQTKETKLYRGLDMIQWNISMQDTLFKIEDCIYSIKVSMEISAQPMFLSVHGMLKKEDSYLFKTEMEYEY